MQKDVNQKIDSLETRMDERFDKVEDRLTKVEIGQAELKGELKGDIKVLDEKIEGLTVRDPSNREYFSLRSLHSFCVHGDYAESI